VLTYARTAGSAAAGNFNIAIGGRGAIADGLTVDLFLYGEMSHALADSRVFSAAEHKLVYDSWSETPAAIHHYDLSVGDYTVSATDIIVIPDQIGTADLSLTTSSAWPQTGASINGLDVADFISAGSDHIYTNTGVSSSLSGVDVAYSFAMVVQSDAPTVDTHMFAFNNTTTGDEYISHYQRSSPNTWSNIRRDDSGNPSGTINLGPAPTSDPTILVYVYQTETLTLYVNGVEVYQSESYDDPETVMTDLNRLTMGGWKSGTSAVFGPLDGKIGEVKIWNQALTSPQVKRLNDELKIKWGIR